MEQIKITSEVLQQHGFVTTDAEPDYVEYEKDGVVICNEGGLHDEENSPYYFEYGYSKQREIKYLYELKTLFKFLTGKEL